MFPNSNKPIVLLLFVLTFILFAPKTTSIPEFPVFRVVIDPGHGGFGILPKKKHGDRYDSISGTYLSYYKPGTAYGSLEERDIAYSIAEKVKYHLDHTMNDSGFYLFNELVEKITGRSVNRIKIRADLSRGKSLSLAEADKEDPNAGYRLFDYIDIAGNKKPGRISYINSLKPHLVVSLHCDYQAPVYFRGINPVITAPFSIMKQGLGYMQGSIKDRKFFFNSPYADWFTETNNGSGFSWFLKDTSVYFTGFPVNKRGIVEGRFNGYIYNMVSWNYKDDNGWESAAGGHPAGSRYASDPGDFVIEGRFWDREQSIYESYRREGGMEGFGGDNLYASSEIIRYMLLSLYKTGNYYPGQKLGEPYISVWSVPILVNAVSAYIELGYLKKYKDRYILSKKQDEVAEGIAVGIYSLFAGIDPEAENEGFKYMPKGKSLDLEKYRLPSGENYFDIVTP